MLEQISLIPQTRVPFPVPAVASPASTLCQKIQRLYQSANCTRESMASWRERTIYRIQDYIPSFKLAAAGALLTAGTIDIFAGINTFEHHHQEIAALGAARLEAYGMALLLATAQIGIGVKVISQNLSDPSNLWKILIGAFGAFPGFTLTDAVFEKSLSQSTPTISLVALRAIIDSGASSLIGSTIVISSEFLANKVLSLFRRTVEHRWNMQRPLPEI